MYADRMTESIKNTLSITESRRKIQEEYNKKHNIIPRTVKRDLTLLAMVEEAEQEVQKIPVKKGQGAPVLDIDEVRREIIAWDRAMRKAAKELRFEDAAHARDMMRKFQQMELALT